MTELERRFQRLRAQYDELLEFSNFGALEQRIVELSWKVEELPRDRHLLALLIAYLEIWGQCRGLLEVCAEEKQCYPSSTAT